MNEDEILAALKEAYEAEKTAISTLDWKLVQPHQQILKLPIACSGSSASVMGVSIFGTAYVQEPERHVSFQLCIDYRGIDYRIARIDWRPRQPHTNRYGPTKGLKAYTSIHDFSENAALGLRKMQDDNLPIVKPIDPEPEDFAALLVYVRDTFHLDNACDIPIPPWSRGLF